MVKNQIENLKRFKRDYGSTIGPVFVKENYSTLKMFDTIPYKGNLIRIGKCVVDGQCERNKTKRGRINIESGKIIPIISKKEIVAVIILKRSLLNETLNKYGLRLATDKETEKI